MTGLLAFLAEHGATFAALLAIARMLAQTRQARAEAEKVAAETVAEATKGLRDALEREQKRGDRLETEGATLAGQERGCRVRVAEIADDLARAKADVAAAQTQAASAEARAKALKDELDEHFAAMAAGGYRGGA